MRQKTEKIQKMKKCLAMCLMAAVFVTASTQSGAQALANEPLRLVQTISMPKVKGRLDHMYVDAKGKRLFVAGLENGTLEVIDLQAGKWMHSIPGFKKPQGVLFLPELNK